MITSVARLVFFSLMAQSGLPELPQNPQGKRGPTGVASSSGTPRIECRICPPTCDRKSLVGLWHSAHSTSVLVTFASERACVASVERRAGFPRVNH